LNVATKAFSDLVGAGLEVRAIYGNHDIGSRDGAWGSNAIYALEHAGVQCVNKPHYFIDDNVLMLPWVEPVKSVVQLLRDKAHYHTGADVIMHAPLNGVLSGIPDHGLDPLQVSRLGFKRVFTGHYHNHTNFNDSVYSIGAMTHQTWSDVGTQAGFLIVTEDSVTHEPTQAPLFIDFDPTQPDKAQGNYVRYKVGSATAAEVGKYRTLLTQLGAKGVVINAAPKAKVNNRGVTVQSGASLEQSVGEFVQAHSEYPDKQALSQFCLDLLRETT
jgi:hypothetical protein